jgi:hypothetical protein
MVALPKIEINGIDLVKWEAEPPIRDNGYEKIKELQYVRNLVAVFVDVPSFRRKHINKKIACPDPKKGLPDKKHLRSSQ